MTAQKETRAPRLCCRAHQPPGGNKVEGGGRSPKLHDHGAQGCAPQRLPPDPQALRHVPGIHQDQPVGVESEMNEAMGINPAAFRPRHPVPHPDERAIRVTSTLSNGPDCQRQRKAPGGRQVPERARVNLMHRAPGQPATQVLVRILKAKREKALPRGSVSALKGGNPAAQGGKGIRHVSDSNVHDMFYIGLNGTEESRGPG